jgi:hypothetical protein
MITEDYVSFETAKLLRERGFDEDIDLWYDENGEMFSQHKYDINHDWRVRANQEVYECPTLQMAMKWLRDEKGIAVIPIISSVLDNEKFLWDVKIVVAKTNDTYSQGWVYEKQEQACEAAIKYYLENLI